MKVSKIIAWIAFSAFVVIQFFPVQYNQSETVPQTDFMLVNNVPTTVNESLQVSCYDCHSNNTEYPWYHKIQPAAWFMEDHIEHGKGELNFNEWSTYSDRRKNSKLRSIVNQIESGEMPLTSYTLIHSDAVLSEAQQNEVIAYMKQLKDTLNQSN